MLKLRMNSTPGFFVFSLLCVIFQCYVCYSKVNTSKQYCQYTKNKESKDEVDCSFMHLSILPSLEKGLHYNIVNLTGNNFYRFDIDVSKKNDGNEIKANSLYLDKCNIHNIFEHTFRRFTGLRVLDLSYNQLFTLPPPMYYNPIRELYLHHNPINKIDHYGLMYLKDLEILDLSHCNISFVSKTLFKDLGNLKKLILNNNILKILPTNLFSNISKCETDVTDNPLQSDYQNCGLLKYMKENEGCVKYDKNTSLFNQNDSFCEPKIRLSVNESENTIQCRAFPIEGSEVTIYWHFIDENEQLEIVNSRENVFGIKIENDVQTSKLIFPTTCSRMKHRIQCQFKELFGEPSSQVVFTNHESKVLSPGRVWAIYGDESGIQARCPNCNLQSVPEIDKEYGKPYSLGLIDISQNNIGTLTDDIFYRKSKPSVKFVKELYLRSCNIHSISNGAFQGMDRLEILDLYGNNLTIVPTWSFHLLINLKKLLLRSNQIKHISSSSTDFTNLSKLEVLDLSSCGIQQIDNNIFGPLSNSLKELLLNYNNLTNLPFDYQKPTDWVALHILNMRHNPSLSQIHAYTFGGMESLEQLDLSYCSICAIDVDAFRRFNLITKSNFEIVDQSENNSTIHNSTVFSNFDGFEHLKSISNKEMRDEKNFSILLKKLTDLKLNNNRLKIVSHSFIKAFRNTTTIYLQNNKFSCDCDNYDLFKMTKSKLFYIVISDADFEQCQDSLSEFICKPHIIYSGNSECYVQTKKRSTILKWYWDNVIIPDASSSFITSNAFQFAESNSGDSIVSQFNFTKVGISYVNYKLKCIAENSVGSDSSIINLNGDPKEALGVHMEQLQVD